MTYLIYIQAWVLLWINTRPKIDLLNRKPFNCELCLVFWVTLIYCYHQDLNYSIAPINALAAPLIKRIYDKAWLYLMK